jgi:DnaJ family protein C protein 16
MFGYLSLEKGLEWYKRLLTLSLPEPRDLNINPKNCIGTVLSLNGHRKYFCMYHAKHPESMKGKGSKVSCIQFSLFTFNSNITQIYIIMF